MKNDINNKWDIGEYFDFAYALTTHLAQGSEYPSCMFIEEYLHPQIMNQLIYTGITRAKSKLIYIRKKNKMFSFPGLN
jgi:ATP-dependent exoDNAse (exonuclease V) alpha subunit